MFRRRLHSQNYYSNRGNKMRSRRALGNIFRTIKNLAGKTCVVFLFGGIIYAILFTPLLAVKNVIVEGNKAITSGEIEKIIISLAVQKIFKIFNNNLLLINPADMESAITNRFGNIDNVKVEKKFPQTIKIIIAEKPADISWCNKITIEKVAKDKNSSKEKAAALETAQCYLSDEDGIVYQKIINEASANSIKVFRNEPISMGVRISDDATKIFIRKLAANFNKKTGLVFSQFYAPDISSRELHAITDKGWKIYFDLNRDTIDQLDVLNSALKNTIPETDKAKMDYINLLVPDRVYYNIK